MCLFVDGGGWTVIQRRGHFGSSENFYRGWNDYRNGFGDPYKVSHFNKIFLKLLSLQAIRMDSGTKTRLIISINMYMKYDLHL